MLWLFSTLLFLIFPLSYSRILSSFNQNKENSGNTVYYSKEISRFSFENKSRLKRQTTSAKEIKAFSSKLGSLAEHNQALMHWSGNNSKIVYVLLRKKNHLTGEFTGGGALWRSDDYGETFQEDKGKFDENTLLKNYYVSPHNRSKVIFTDSYLSLAFSSRIWVSINEGKSYLKYNLPMSLSRLLYHPDHDKQDWLLGFDGTSSILYVSTNLGQNWSELQKGVSKDRYFWYRSGIDLYENASAAVHVEYQKWNASTNRTSYFIRSCFIPSCIPTPFERDCVEMGEIVSQSFLVQGNYAFAQKMESHKKLFVSYKRQSFVKAKFYSNDEELDFHVVSTDGGTILLGVNNAGGITDLYSSDEKGRRFALTLANVRYFLFGKERKVVTDIHKVQSIKGTYIVNKLTRQGLNQTLITWDNGKHWTHLAIPSHDVKGKPMKRCKRCYLNLHCGQMMTPGGTFMPPMHSGETPGLIIAMGSVGSNLVDDPSAVSIYVSDDAGVTWRQGPLKRHHYAIADQGSVIAAVELSINTRTSFLSLSTDFGRSWSLFRFSDSPIFVDGLLTEPGSFTHKMTLFGHRQYNQSWNLFGLDLASVFSRNCSYPKDFKNQTMPPSRHWGKCHLGANFKVELLNNFPCLVGPHFRRKTEEEKCICTDDDYQCDFGFIRQIDSSCSELTDRYSGGSLSLTSSNPSSPCVDGYTKVFLPYRRIPGDNCVFDLPGKLHTFERCADAIPGARNDPKFSLKLFVANQSSVAKVGESLLIIAKTKTTITWSVKRLFPPFDPMMHLTVINKTLLLNPVDPGEYEVAAKLLNDTSTIHKRIRCSFWYAISSVTLWHEPITEINKSFDIYAYVTARRGLLGKRSLLGDVHYSWYNPLNKTAENENINEVSLIARKIGSMEISVLAKNAVSWKRRSCLVLIKECVQKIILPLVPSQPINSTMTSFDWLKEINEHLKIKLFQNGEFSQAIHKHNFTFGENLHIYTRPSAPLCPILILSSACPNERGRSKFLGTVAEIFKVLNSATLTTQLDNHIRLFMEKPYIFCDTSSSPCASAYVTDTFHPAIILIAICSLLLGIIAIYFGRMVIRRIRSALQKHVTSKPINYKLRYSRAKRSADSKPIIIDDETGESSTLQSSQKGEGIVIRI